MNAPDPRPAPSRTLHLNIVGGQRLSAIDDRTIDVVCPSDGLAFAAIPRSGAAEVDAAVEGSRPPPPSRAPGAGSRPPNAAAFS
jgi:aldehyde dehydrogenase (NAD+)